MFDNKPSIKTPAIVVKDTATKGLNVAIANNDNIGQAEDLSIYWVISLEVMKTIQADIEKITLPSWIEWPPSNFGSPSHGKLKADHWCTVCTINFIVTLVHLWGHEECTTWEKNMLRNFLNLVIAIKTVTRHSISPAQVKTYKFYMH